MNILDKIDDLIAEKSIKRTSNRGNLSESYLNEGSQQETITWKAIDQVRRYTPLEIIKFMVSTGRFAVRDSGSKIELTPKEIADSWVNDFHCEGITQTTANNPTAVWVLDRRNKKGRWIGYDGVYYIFFDPKTGKLVDFYAPGL